MPQAVEAFLRSLNTSDRARAAAFDAVYNMDDTVAEQTLRQLPFSDEVRATLWDARQGIEPDIPRPEVAQSGPPGLLDVSPLLDYLTGAGRGLAHTAVGAGELANQVFGAGRVVDPTVFERARTAIAPTRPRQRAGFALEQLAEFAVPIGGQVKAAQLASRAPRLVRWAARMIGESAEMATKAATQGGDVPTAALAGATVPPVAGAISATGRAFTERLPEKLYGQIFRATPEDIAAQFKSVARGQPKDPTLAREVLERGLYGRSEQLAVRASRELDVLESELQASAKGVMTNISPNKPKFISLLKRVQSTFDDTFFTDRAMEADDLVTALNSMRGGAVRAEDALKLKRFLDRMRNLSSFKLGALEDRRLSVMQDELKAASDVVRGALRQNPKFSTLLNEERIRLQAFEGLVDDAVARKNRRLLNLTDILMGGGGLGVGGPTGMAVGWGAVRGFQQPATLTGVGQGLFRAGKTLRGTGPVATRTVAGATTQRER